jgi:hypothetical protein
MGHPLAGRAVRHRPEPLAAAPVARPGRVRPGGGRRGPGRPRLARSPAPPGEKWP